MGRLQIRLSAASHFTMKEVAMEMKTEREWEQAFVDAVDETYAYEFARRMELPKTNPVLGYRTAGSAAERETGEMIAREMERIGLKNVCRDRIPVDRWEFERAVMRYTDRQGKEHVFQLGAYQTQFVTEGPKPFTLVYLGKATADCYEAQDVRGKLVMGDINQREEWWINFPVYQAYRKGAAAFVAVQDQGYGEIHPTALNAQDIAGPEQAAAFSMSQADAAVIKADMEELVRQGRPPEAAVLFDAATRVERNKETWNILGSIPGREEDSLILLSAHYDSYFNGFQDDNTAVAMMLGIARTLISIGYRPRKTLVFCALAAEEWGIADSKYDWSTGAYQEVFSARPEWRGRVMADLNFELPAYAHGRRDGVRCTYEYAAYMERFIREFCSRHEALYSQAYPEGVEVLCPIQTWSDDFSMAIGGIPSLVNEFSGGEFMETHYHSQFDSEAFYDAKVYRFHHQLYGSLAIALDYLAAAPLDFERVFEALTASVDRELAVRIGAEEGLKELFKEIEGAKEAARRLREGLEKGNQRYRACLERGDEEGARREAGGIRDLRERAMKAFQKEQDWLVRLNWHDDVLFPQEASQNNLRAIYRALQCLDAGNGRAALEAIYEIDNNRYAFEFEEEVFQHFTEYVLKQPGERLQWGKGRILHHENLFGLVRSLLEKTRLEERRELPAENSCPEGNSAVCASFAWEREQLAQTAARQEQCLRDDIMYVTAALRKLHALIEPGQED